MDIEIEDQCRYDYVEVRVDGGDEDGERFCGTNLPDVQTSTGNRMVVKFLSDFYVTSRGFRASYVIVEPPPPTLAPCDQTLTDIEGEITTPNYPGDYETGRECIYTIQVGVVFFLFLSLNVSSPLEVDMRQCLIPSGLSPCRAVSLICKTLLVLERNELTIT